MNKLIKGKNIIISILSIIILILLVIIIRANKILPVDTEFPAGKSLSKVTQLTCDALYNNKFGKAIIFDKNIPAIMMRSGKVTNGEASYDSNKYPTFRYIFSLEDNKISLKKSYPGATDDYTFDVQVNDKYKIMGISKDIRQSDDITHISVPVVILDKQTGHMIMNYTQSTKVFSNDDLITFSELYKCTD